MSWLRTVRLVVYATNVFASPRSSASILSNKVHLLGTDKQKHGKVCFSKQAVEQAAYYRVSPLQDIQDILPKRSCHSTASFTSTEVTDICLDDLKEKIRNKGLLVIDVRNPKETASTGVITDAKMVPLPALSAAFGMTDEDFQTEYGFSKPRQDHALAVYCRSGVRAKTAVEILQTMGYTNVYRYPGGWLEWADDHPGLKREPNDPPA